MVSSSVPSSSESRTGAVAWWKRVLFSEYFVLLLSVFYFAVIASTTRGFASAGNMQNIFSNMLPLLVVAVGQTVVLITGGIDLSVTSIIALSSVMGASVMTANEGWLGGSALAAPAAVAVMLSVGIGLGFLNGLAITLFQMPPFIVTLTSWMFFRGFAIWYTQSANVSGLPAAFSALGRGAWPVAIAGLLFLLVFLLQSRLLLGRWIYAVGHNVKAALISGVPVNRTLLSAYVISGFCAAVASVLYTARLNMGSPTMGDQILLNVIAAVVIGGTSLFGGKGSVLWTVFGVLFITLIDNSLNMKNLHFTVIMMVKGGVILLAALIDVARNRLRDQG